MSVKMKTNCQSTERKVLHLLMKSEHNIEIALAMGLTNDEFSIPRHQSIFDGIIKVYQEHEVNVMDDIDMLVSNIEYEDSEDKKQSLLFVDKIINLSIKGGRTVQDKYLKPYVAKLKELKTVREVVKSVQGITRCLSNENATVEELMETVSDMDEILATSGTKLALRHSHDVVVKDTVKSLLDESEGEEKIKFYISDLDANCKILPGYLTYMIADSGVGKSTALLNLAHKMGGHGVGIGYFSLEMNKEDNMKRMFCMEESILSQHMLIPRLLNNKDWKKIDKILDSEFSKMNIQWYTEPDVDVFEMEKEITRMVKIHDVDVIMVDYYQLLEYDKNENLHDSVRIPSVSRALSVMAAKEYVNPYGKRKKVAIVALSQVIKELLHRENKRPTLHDQYYGGYKDARLVIGLYRDEYYYPETTDKEGIIEYGIIKQNNGVMNVWYDAKFEGDTFVIRDLSEDEKSVIAEMSSHDDEDYDDYEYEDEE